MKYDLSKIVTRSNGEELQIPAADGKTKTMTFGAALNIAIEAQPVEIDTQGQAKPRLPTVKELLERVAIRNKLVAPIVELTAEDVAALKGYAAVSLAMPVSIFIVDQLERPLGE